MLQFPGNRYIREYGCIRRDRRSNLLFFELLLMTGQELFSGYQPYAGTWDEMCQGDSIRRQYSRVFDEIKDLPTDLLQQKVQ